MFSQTERNNDEPLSREERQQHARATTRRAILDAALSLFVSDGYAQVSIRNIAAKVEYSPGAIYSYFTSKDEIFFALAEEGFRLLGASQLQHTPSDNPLDDIRAAAWRFYEFSKAQPQYFALVFLDRRVPRIGREYRAVRIHVRSEEPPARADAALCRRRHLSANGERGRWSSPDLGTHPRNRGSSPLGTASGRRRGRPHSRRDRHNHRWLAGRRTVTCAPLDTVRFVFSF